MVLAAVGKCVHEGRHLYCQLFLLHFLYNVEVVFDLFLLYQLFVALRDVEFEMVAEVFVEDFVEAEDEDCVRAARIELHCLYLSRHG